jgi:c-di-GMP-binding flagellar brake protein YcgR
MCHLVALQIKSITSLVRKEKDRKGPTLSIPYDRRQSPRAAIQWPIIVKTAERPVKAELKDLGAGGAHIRCDQALNPRDFVAITIDPPHHFSLKITAEVVWTDRISSLGLGVRFVEMPEKDRHFLFNEVSDYLKFE